jgi:uncharacterized protein (DUF1810 family)
MSDEYDLTRFMAAQEPVYDDAVSILRSGMMCTPYMDFIFPRLADTYEAETTSPFGLSSLDEARALLAFPVLGDRYRECVRVLDWSSDRTAAAVFGPVDAKRLQESLTLFTEATNEPIMRTMLTIWFDNLADEATMDLIRLDS